MGNVKLYILDTNKYSLSSLHKLVVLGVCNKRAIGVDIENVKEVDLKIKQYISSVVEYKYIKNNINFYQIWANKESLMKCIGKGINKRVDEINALPLNGVRTYLNESYFTNNLMKGGLYGY